MVCVFVSSWKACVWIMLQPKTEEFRNKEELIISLGADGDPNTIGLIIGRGKKHFRICHFGSFLPPSSLPHASARTHTHTHTHTQTCMQAHMHAHTCIHTHAHTHMHARTHTHTHTHTHLPGEEEGGGVELIEQPIQLHFHPSLFRHKMCVCVCVNY